MDDPNRGTGRTTRMIARAVHEIAERRGEPAYVAGCCIQHARGYRDFIVDLCDRLGIEHKVSAVSLAEAKRRRGTGELVFIDHAAVED